MLLHNPADLDRTTQRGIRDARSIYQQEGLYDAYIRQQLQELIRLNKQSHPELFGKKPGG
ncbi:hypothetical protein AB1L42_22470 [Thalassoglobus sp. JC818]|uniref:hypothetical protein n=1 Tax=Thalassoglobus sp. JC818 TaxID=3232136 RepID=UPI003459A9BE